MFDNISYSAIFCLVCGIVFIFLDLYFRKTRPKKNDGMLMLCGLGLILISLGFQYFN